MIGLPWYEEVLRPNCEEEQVSSARAQAVMLHAAMKFWICMKENIQNHNQSISLCVQLVAYRIDLCSHERFPPCSQAPSYLPHNAIRKKGSFADNSQIVGGLVVSCLDPREEVSPTSEPQPPSSCFDDLGPPQRFPFESTARWKSRGRRSLGGDGGQHVAAIRLFHVAHGKCLSVTHESVWSKAAFISLQLCQWFSFQDCDVYYVVPSRRHVLLTSNEKPLLRRAQRLQNLFTYSFHNESSPHDQEEVDQRFTLKVWSVHTRKPQHIQLWYRVNPSANSRFTVFCAWNLLRISRKWNVVAGSNIPPTACMPTHKSWENMDTQVKSSSCAFMSAGLGLSSLTCACEIQMQIHALRKFLPFFLASGNTIAQTPYQSHSLSLKTTYTQLLLSCHVCACARARVCVCRHVTSCVPALLFSEYLSCVITIAYGCTPEVHVRDFARVAKLRQDRHMLTITHASGRYWNNSDSVFLSCSLHRRLCGWAMWLYTQCVCIHVHPYTETHLHHVCMTRSI